MRIGFIFPSSSYLYDPFRGDPHSHFQILTVLDQHFGNKHDLSLIDLRGIEHRFAQYRIPECDVYLHSVYTLDFDEQKSIVSYLQERHPNAIHVAGGPLVNFSRENCLQVFDILVHGDGEESIKKVVNDIENSSFKKDYYQEGEIDINKYHYPLRKFLPKSTVARPGLMITQDNPEYGKLISTTTVFSRGCPFSCPFCIMPSSRAFNPKPRYRKPELIAEEIEYLKREYDIEGINLSDEICMPPVHKQAIPHLKAIKGTNIMWRGQCRVDTITPDIARLLKDSRCIAMGLGVESVSQRSLDLINKRISVNQAKKTIKLLNDNEIETRVYLILGLPGEPNDIVEQTWQFIKETDPGMVYLSLLTIREGTEMNINPKKYGIKKIDMDKAKTMHLYGRYEKEIPKMTFEYEENTPWGKGFSSEEIVHNYLKLQEIVIDNGYGPPKN